MSDAFTNYLSGNGSESLRDYQHANRLYVTNSYANSPKFGFIYYVSFKFNEAAILDKSWTKHKNTVGLLAKRTDLPKFTIATETLNQYNRKTVVQTKLTYAPISIELHDDNSDITHKFWVNYYKHYFADGNYGNTSGSTTYNNSGGAGYSDTKYGGVDYTYGLYDNGELKPFIDSIDIYVLHQGKFTQYTLVNPKITEWAHDALDQAEGNKILKNRLNIAYESVIYKEGRIVPNQVPESWGAVYYDNTPSPLSVGGNHLNTTAYTRAASPFDTPGPERVYGAQGGPYTPRNPLLDIGMILAKNYVNTKGIARVKGVGYNIASGALGAALSTDAGKYSSPPPTENQPGIFNLPGGIGINIFKGFNTSVDGKIRANPAAIIFPKLGR